MTTSSCDYHKCQSNHEKNIKGSYNICIKSWNEERNKQTKENIKIIKVNERYDMLWKHCFAFVNQVGIVIISHAFHLYNPSISFWHRRFFFLSSFLGGVRLGQWSSVAPPTSTTRDRARTWAEICWSQSDSEGFSPGTPVFLPLQIRLSRQNLSRRAIKH